VYISNAVTHSSNPHLKFTLPVWEINSRGENKGPVAKLRGR